MTDDQQLGVFKAMKVNDDDDTSSKKNDYCKTCIHSAPLNDSYWCELFEGRPPSVYNSLVHRSCYRHSTTVEKASVKPPTAKFCDLCAGCSQISKEPEFVWRSQRYNSLATWCDAYSAKPPSLNEARPWCSRSNLPSLVRIISSVHNSTCTLCQFSTGPSTEWCRKFKDKPRNVKNCGLLKYHKTRTYFEFRDIKEIVALMRHDWVLISSSYSYYEPRLVKGGVQRYFTDEQTAELKRSGIFKHAKSDDVTETKLVENMTVDPQVCVLCQRRKHPLKTCKGCGFDPNPHGQWVRDHSKYCLSLEGLRRIVSIFNKKMHKRSGPMAWQLVCGTDEAEITFLGHKVWRGDVIFRDGEFGQYAKDFVVNADFKEELRECAMTYLDLITSSL